MIEVARIRGSSDRWGDPVDVVLRNFISYRNITREQIISISFLNEEICIIIFDDKEE